MVWVLSNTGRISMPSSSSAVSMQDCWLERVKVGDFRGDLCVPVADRVEYLRYHLHMTLVNRVAMYWVWWTNECPYACQFSRCLTIFKQRGFTIKKGRISIASYWLTAMMNSFLVHFAWLFDVSAGRDSGADEMKQRKLEIWQDSYRSGLPLKTDD